MAAFIIKFHENWNGFIEWNFVIFLKKRVKIFLVLVCFFGAGRIAMLGIFILEFPV